MEVLWFCLLAFILTGYVLLDGYDLGAGLVSLFLARDDQQRQQVIASIHPFWDANEVWLIAAGGTLLFAFPKAFSAAFAGFYLPLMVVLWLLIGRAVAIEFRHLVHSSVWRPLWDTVFALSSTLLAVFFGAALGNVIRGVPLDPQGEFFLPLWTNFGIDGEVGILDWYTIPAALFSTSALALHGALWLAHKVEGPLAESAAKAARWLIVSTTLIAATVTLLTFRVQPQAQANLTAHPWGAIFPVLSIAGLAACHHFLSKNERLKAFLSSALFLTGMLASAAFTVFPLLVPAVRGNSPHFPHSLTIYNAAPSAYGLGIGLAWWIPGMALAVAYSVFIHRHFAEKVPLEADHE